MSGGRRCSCPHQTARRRHGEAWSVWSPESGLRICMQVRPGTSCRIGPLSGERQVPGMQRANRISALTFNWQEVAALTKLSAPLPSKAWRKKSSRMAFLHTHAQPIRTVSCMQQPVPLHEHAATCTEPVCCPAEQEACAPAALHGAEDGLDVGRQLRVTAQRWQLLQHQHDRVQDARHLRPPEILTPSLF